MSGLGPLEDGGRVGIIGGGPGGASCALALQRLAAQSGRRLAITVFEGKQFASGRHHNLCVGIVSPPLPELLADRLGMPDLEQLWGGIVTGYVLHTSGAEIVLDDENHPSYAVRRVQFDDFMLEGARARGVNIVEARTNALEFHADRAVVYSESAPVEVDVVVGAFGLDEGAAGLFQETVGYRQPQSLVSALSRYYPGPEDMARFGPRIHALLPNDPEIEFAALTPKGDHLNVNIAGAAVDTDTMRRFLATPKVRSLLPGLEQVVATDGRGLPTYRGRFPCSLAHLYTGDRYVMVGDAAGLVHAFKGKGVTSAVQTGIRAAETILQAGISEQAFNHHYGAANRDITDDLPWGQVVRRIVRWSSHFGLLDVVVRAAEHDDGVREALFGAVSGHEMYRKVLGRMFNPRAIVSVLRTVLS